MSKNNKFKDSACRFETQIVSYLYDEATVAEKNEVEAHAAKCSVCADEIAAFGNVRFSIAEWRDQEFAKFETPSVQIPKSKKIAERSPTMFENFRNFLGFSNGWATAAFAGLIILFALGFVIFNFSNVEELASNTNKIADEREVLQNDAAIENSVLTDNKVEKSEEIPDENLSKANPETADNSFKKKDAPPEVVPKVNKSGIKKRDSKKAGESRVKTPLATQTANQPKKPKADQLQTKPSLTNFGEESEDDSLRLADLFDEVESR